MTKLALSPALSLPLDAVTQRLAFLGKPGSGKSYAATKLAEMLYDAGAQFVAIDPVGVWFGLRMDGKGKGIPIPVFGGLHGDLPLDPTSGVLFADLIVDRRLSCVLDVSQFEHDTDKARFATAFAARFFYRMKAAPSAVHIFLEECQEFVPQNPQRGEERMLHEFTRMDKLGRNFGIGMSLITQRPQEVNKKVLNLTECLLAFQMTGAHERKAIKEWISTVGGDEQILTTLPGLAVAHAHVYSPQWLRVSEVIKIGEKRTADVSSTPTVGASKVAGKPLTPVDLVELRTKLSESIEKAKADDPAELRREIARLRKQLIAPGGSHTIIRPADEKTVERAVAAALRHREADDAAERRQNVAGMKSVRDQLCDYQTRLGGIATRLAHDIETLGMAIVRASERVMASPPAAQFTARPTPAEATPRRVPRPGIGVVIRDANISGVGQRILDTIAGMAALGVEQPDKATVAALVGYHPNAKSYSNAMGSLRTAGYIEYPPGGRLALTDVGAGIASASIDVETVAELHALWFGRLGNVAERILRPILEAYPEAVDASAVAEAAGYHPNAKSFSNMKGRLRTLGLIDYPAPGRICATHVLFPEGLR